MKIQIDIEKNIGLQMRTIRELLNLKSQDVARLINISTSLYSYYENNKRPQRIEILRRFVTSCKNYQKNYEN